MLFYHLKSILYQTFQKDDRIVSYSHLTQNVAKTPSVRLLRSSTFVSPNVRLILITFVNDKDMAHSFEFNKRGLMTLKLSMKQK